MTYWSTACETYFSSVINWHELVTVTGNSQRRQEKLTTEHQEPRVNVDCSLPDGVMFSDVFTHCRGKIDLKISFFSSKVLNLSASRPHFEAADLYNQILLDWHHFPENREAFPFECGNVFLLLHSRTACSGCRGFLILWMAAQDASATVQLMEGYMIPTNPNKRWSEDIQR